MSYEINYLRHLRGEVADVIRTTLKEKFSVNIPVYTKPKGEAPTGDYIYLHVLSAQEIGQDVRETRVDDFGVMMRESFIRARVKITFYGDLSELYSLYFHNVINGSEDVRFRFHERGLSVLKKGRNTVNSFRNGEEWEDSYNFEVDFTFAYISKDDVGALKSIGLNGEDIELW